MFAKTMKLIIIIYKTCQTKLNLLKIRDYIYSYNLKEGYLYFIVFEATKPICCTRVGRIRDLHHC